MTFRMLRVGFLASVLLGVLALAPVHAEIITFDNVILSPVDPDPIGDNPGDIGLQFDTPNVNPPLTFSTQGFNFGGYTNLLNGMTNTQPELLVVTEPEDCPGLIGTACADNGTNYLAAGEPLGFHAQSGTFALLSFDASQLFIGGVCEGCNDGEDIGNLTNIVVTGFFAGAQVAQQTFNLGQGFQTFVLGPGFENVARVTFSSTGPEGYGAVDNINVVAVNPIPEPASMMLLGSGLAALAARRRKR